MSERIELATAKADIEKAFDLAESYAARETIDGTWTELQGAHARVTTFLAQVEADQRNPLGGATTDDLIIELQRHIATMTPDDRLEVFEVVAGGYCKHCGDAEPSRGCVCMRDE